MATVESAVFGALIHDIVSIQSNGLDVKTNFNYTKFEVLLIISRPSLFANSPVNVKMRSKSNESVSTLINHINTYNIRIQ